jgi:hypothetical protein
MNFPVSNFCASSCTLSLLYYHDITFFQLLVALAWLFPLENLMNLQLIRWLQKSREGKGSIPLSPAKSCHIELFLYWTNYSLYFINFPELAQHLSVWK